MSNNDVQLAWCLVDGERKHVRAFEEWRGKSDRPTNMVCPCCNEAVIIALSPERKIADHFKHKPDSSCLIRQGGESASHLNAKSFFAELLSKAETLHVEIRCGECQRICDLAIIEDYKVEIEYTIKSRRPDLALIINGEPVLAIEIFHTHKINREKAEDFSKNGIRWIEITAEDAMSLTRDDDQIVLIEAEVINDCYLNHGELQCSDVINV